MPPDQSKSAPAQDIPVVDPTPVIDVPADVIPPEVPAEVIVPEVIVPRTPEEEHVQLLSDIDSLANQRVKLLEEIADLEVKKSRIVADTETAKRNADIAIQQARISQ